MDELNFIIIRCPSLSLVTFVLEVVLSHITVPTPAPFGYYLHGILFSVPFLSTLFCL